MAELIDVANAMLKNKKDWVKISDDDKEKFFFIINRYLSKKYTENAYLLNQKGIDKVLAMDLWYNFMLKQPYPKWFWSKSPKNEKTELPVKDYKLLLTKLKVKTEDLDYLIDKFPDFIKEELKYYKLLEKGN